MEGRNNLALLMAMRTGKTKVVIDRFGILHDRGEVDDLLVVAPAGCYQTWAQDDPDPENREGVYKHLDPAMLAKLRVHVWRASDKGKAADERLRRFLAYRRWTKAPAWSTWRP
jgi:hypothetical protein